MRRKHWPRKSGLGLGLGVGGGGIGYYLNDTFTTARLAGAVNGTAAEPGPGGLRDTDETDLSAGIYIDSTALIIPPCTAANKTGAASNIHWTAITRSVGTLILSKSKASDASAVNTTMAIGLTSANPPTFASTEIGYGFNNQKLTAQTGVSVNVTIGDYANDTYYKLATVIKSTGAYYFLYDTVWRLYYISSYGNTASLLPCIFNRNATTTQTSDFIRIPTMLWCPRPISADDFGGTHPILDNAVSTLTGLEAYTGATRIWGEYLSGTGTTGAGVSWDHEWEFAAGSLADTGAIGGLTLTAGGTNTDTTDWANRADHAKLFDGNDRFTVTSGNDIGNPGATFTVLVEGMFGSTGDRQPLCSVGLDAVADCSWMFYTFSGALNVKTSNGAAMSTMTGLSFEANKHYQIIYTLSGGTGKIYLNGVLADLKQW